MDGSIKEKFSGSKLTSKSTLSVLAFMVLAIGISAPSAFAQNAGTDAVSLGQNGIFVNQGTLDMKGNDIQDAGTTIWDASQGNIATAVVDYSAATAADVGLGNVRNVDLANTAGDYISYDGSFNTYNVNKSAIDTTVDGCSTCLDIGSEVSNNIGTTELYAGGLVGDNSIQWTTSSGTGTGLDGDGDADALIDAADNIQLISDSNADSGGSYGCYMDGENGSWNCDGSKNWIHELNETHDAVYSSQESPMVRAVYEGQTNITDGIVNVSLPSHFSKTVSDSKPSLRVQATPHSLVNVAVTDRTDEYLVIKVGSSETVEVDYRVTGIREGYENKDVVRPKE